MSHFCSATMPSAWPLLTGNGNSIRFSVLVRLAYKLRSRLVALCKNNGRNYAQTDLGCGVDRGTDSGRTCRGAIADRDQVQPRGGDQYAEGTGGREVQGTGREIHRGQGQGRSLSELAALQGQGRAGGAATRRGADAGALELEVRPDRGQGIRGVRSALHPPRPEDAAQSHRRPARREAAQAPG